ncbi:MAG TPA: GNAT family N-acetyltransferase [Solirubrobacterales bacterium]|jgi:GNAT superfamily N-acetyltransferase|nr:GNAT family N-acetyltransferase [Solirubrobacterales bacterium]
MADANDVQIRAAAEADVPLLFDLILELAEYEKLDEKVAGDAEVLRRSLFEEKAAEALLIETADGETVGYAIFFTTFSTFECRSGFWLEDVYVRPEHRRGGIGRAVMEHLAQIAQERGHVRLEWVALDWNEPALNFYEGLGAKRLDAWIIHRLEKGGIRGLAEGDGGPSADEGGVSGEGPPSP